MQESPEQTTQATSTAQDFKKKREERDAPQPLTLSSGLVVLVKKPSIKKLIATGIVPDSLAAKIINMSDDGGRVRAFKPSDLTQLIEMQKVVTKYAVVSPKIVDAPDYDANEIHIDDLDEDDLDSVFNYVNQGVPADSTAANFRNGE